MPWHIAQRNGEYCVIKDTDNSVEGCHATRGEAADQIRALYANEADMADQIPADHLKDMEEIAGELHHLADQLLGYHGENAPVESPVETPMEEDYAATGYAEADLFDIETPVPEHYSWEGVITYEGIETGDRRFFQEGSVIWNEELLPFPFNWQRISSEGHDSSVTIGRVDSIFRGESGEIRGRGIILSGPEAPPEAQEYVTLLKVGAAGGVSIDGDSAQFEVQGELPEEMRMVFNRINIRALTAVSIPAFAGAKITLCDTIVAAVIGSTSLPVTDRSRNWDGLAAQRSIWAWAKTADGFDEGKLSQAFLWRDSDGDPQAKGSYKLPFTEVISGTLTIVPKAVFAAAAAVEGARGGVKIPDSDKAGIRRKLGTLYNKIPPVEGEEGHPTPPWDSPSGDAADETLDFNRTERSRDWEYELQELVASAIPVNPPMGWFETPKFSELTPMTITDEGAVYGHLCGKETCHIGFGTCRTSPRGCNYDSYFHLGEIRTAEGVSVNVGHMTFGGGHAELNQGAQAAAAHYDATSRVSADIRAGEDEYGTWIVGALRPTLSAEDIREIRSAPLSGDWRPIKGKLQLIAAHAVNVPGFPVPRAQVLVASGVTETIIITDTCGCMDEEFASLLFAIDIEELQNESNCKTEGGACFPSGDFAYVPDSNKPSTWKLRLTESPGATPTAAQVGRAIAALGKGFRGNKVQIPSEDLAKVKSKVRSAWRKANPDKSADEMPDVIKEK